MFNFEMYCMHLWGYAISPDTQFKISWLKFFLTIDIFILLPISIPILSNYQYYYQYYYCFLSILLSCSQKNSRFPKVAWSKADQSFATRCLISCPPNKLAFILQISQNDIMASKHFFGPKKIAKKHTHILFGEVLLRVKTLLYNYISSKKGHLQQIANAENTCSASKRSFCRMARRGLGSKRLANSWK